MVQLRKASPPTPVFSVPPSTSVYGTEAAIEPGVAHTARWTAALRSMEHDSNDALFSDPLACAFAGECAIRKWKQDMSALFEGQPGTKSHIAIRARAIDDIVSEEIEGMCPTDLVQVVSLGAGMCTRPWRLAPEGDVTWFEIDRPDSIRLKDSIAKEQAIQPSVGAVSRIGVDFSDKNASISAALQARGFDKQASSIFVMEGLLPYLEVNAIREMAEEINELAEGTTRLVMTVINDGFYRELTHPKASTVQKYPGTSEVATLFHSSWEDGIKQAFEDAGWSVVSIISREDYATEYLGCEMVTYTFPDRNTSTEYIIVMERHAPGAFAAIRDALGLGWLAPDW